MSIEWHRDNLNEQSARRRSRMAKRAGSKSKWRAMLAFGAGSSITTARSRGRRARLSKRSSLWRPSSLKPVNVFRYARSAVHGSPERRILITFSEFPGVVASGATPRKRSVTGVMPFRDIATL